MEAALAFTGLAASLVTLLAVVHDSCKTIHAVSGFYKKAPRLLIQLKDDVDRTEDLLRAIVIQSRRRKSELVSEELRELWDKTRAQLETDYKEINSIVKKLHKKSRVNFYFKGDQIESLKIRIGRHIETLILIRSLATRYFGRQISSQAVVLMILKRSDCKCGFSSGSRGVEESTPSIAHYHFHSLVTPDGHFPSTDFTSIAPTDSAP